MLEHGHPHTLDGDIESRLVPPNLLDTSLRELIPLVMLQLYETRVSACAKQVRIWCISLS